MDRPGFFAILPANVRYDRRLKPAEKILYAEIASLTNVTGYCYASNEYFEELYDASTRTVQGWIKHLQDIGYIQVQVVYGDKPGGQRRISPLTGLAPEENNPAEKCAERKKMRGTPAEKCAGTPQKNAPRLIQDNINTREINAGAGARAHARKAEDVLAEFAGDDTQLRSALEDFVEFRRQGKHPLTSLAASRVCCTLRRLADEAHPKSPGGYMIACLNQSIERGWEGLFAVKDYADTAQPVAPAGTPPAPVRQIAPGDDITKYL